jgi:hypothetical protein
MSTVTKKDLRNYYNQRIALHPENNFLTTLKSKIPGFFKLIKQTRDIEQLAEKDTDYVVMFYSYEHLKIISIIRNGCRNVEVLKKLYDDLANVFLADPETYNRIQENHRQILIDINNRVPESNKIAVYNFLCFYHKIMIKQSTD